MWVYVQELSIEEEESKKKKIIDNTKLYIVEQNKIPEGESHYNQSTTKESKALLVLQ